MGILAERMARVSVSATLKVAAEAERLRRAGHNVIDFSAGEPDFPTPEHVKAAGKDAIDQNFTRYTAINVFALGSPYLPPFTGPILPATPTPPPPGVP